MTRNLHKDNSNVRDDDCEQCFYCDMMFGSIHHEHDHAPIPKTAGGLNIVPICANCHDMKDRYSFASWHAGTFADTVMTLIESGRIKDFSANGALFPNDLPTEFPNEWSKMGRWERIAWAKIANASHKEPTKIPSVLLSL